MLYNSINVNERMRALAEICQSYNIDILYVFGSRANEIKTWISDERCSLKSRPTDVDLGVKPARRSDFNVRDKVRFALAIEDLLGVARVDLVSLRDSDPFLAANIIRGERIFARDQYLADEYDLYVLRRAGDLAQIERERMALILGDIS